MLQSPSIHVSPAITIQAHFAPHGTPTKLLKETDSDALRDRYWHLWKLNHPHFGIPRYLQATLDKSPMAKTLRRVRQRELIRIERIVVVQRGESLKMGTKYESLFGCPGQ